MSQSNSQWLQLVQSGWYLGHWGQVVCCRGKTQRRQTLLWPKRRLWGAGQPSETLWEEEWTWTMRPRNSIWNVSALDRDNSVCYWYAVSLYSDRRNTPATPTPPHCVGVKHQSLNHSNPLVENTVKHKSSDLINSFKFLQITELSNVMSIDLHHVMRGLHTATLKPCICCMTVED